MSSEWTDVSLEDIADLNGGYAFKSDEYTETGHFVLRTVNITDDGRICQDGAAYVSLAPAKKYERFLLKDLDTLFVMVGATLGKTGLVKAEDLPALLNQNMWVVRAKPDRIDPLFLHYAFKVISQPMCSLASGSARGFVKRDDFRQMKVRVPASGVQRKISELLGTLDDRITLLRETNTTLEAIAQALFKSWFVDFDPVHAKMEGRAPEGMDEDTARLFPDGLEESELGLVPRGWRVKPLDTIASFLNGLALQKFPATGQDDLPVIKIAQLRKGDSVGADQAARSIKPEYIVKNGDVLFSWSGSLEVEIWCGGEGALNQHLFKVTSVDFPKWFYFLWTRHHLADFRQTAASKATTMGHIQRGHLTAAKVCIPTAAAIEAATSVLGPIIQMLIQNSLQAQTLATLRDTLLPRLISGQLRLPEVVNQLEEALS